MLLQKKGKKKEQSTVVNDPPDIDVTRLNVQQTRIRIDIFQQENGEVFVFG